MNEKTILTVIFILLSASFCGAQTTSKKDAAQNGSLKIINQAKNTPAYAELLLRKTECESELEEFLLDYTDEFPKVKELKFELDLLKKEMDKVLAVSASEANKLTLALGKLIVRKIELETDVWNLKRQYNEDHPEVKRARRKVAVYEKAIKEIL